MFNSSSKLLLLGFVLAGSTDGHTAVHKLLESQGLEHIEPRLEVEGLAHVCDFALLSDKDLEDVGVSQLLPRRKLQRAAAQLCHQDQPTPQQAPPPGIAGVRTFSCIENGILVFYSLRTHTHTLLFATECT